MAERKLTYCSFADEDRCLGITILEGDFDSIRAAIRANRLGLDPGGKVTAVSCCESDPNIPSWVFETLFANRDRLLSAEELGDLFAARSSREFEAVRKGTPEPN